MKKNEIKTRSCNKNDHTRRATESARSCDYYESAEREQNTHNNTVLIFPHGAQKKLREKEKKNQPTSKNELLIVKL